MESVCGQGGGGSSGPGSCVDAGMNVSIKTEHLNIEHLKTGIHTTMNILVAFRQPNTNCHRCNHDHEPTNQCQC